MHPFSRSQITAPDTAQNQSHQRSSGPDAGLPILSDWVGSPNDTRDTLPRSLTPDAAEQAAIDDAVAERLLDLLEKAEQRRGQFTVPEAELLGHVGKELGIPLNLIESLATRLADTGRVGRSLTCHGPVLHRDLSLSERMVRGILHVIHGSERNGHAALLRPELTAAAAKRLLCTEDAVLEGVETLIAEHVLVAERIGGDILVFTAAAHSAEMAMVKHLMELTASSAVKIPRRRRIQKTISRAEKRSGLVLNAAQAEAIATILRYPVSIVTGAPGVGKTTVIRAAVDALARLSREKPVLLAAPTGKAARRLSEAAKQPAQTIHRLLCWSPEAGGFTRDEGNPLEAFAVIVDEASMIDLVLMADLLAAIPRGCRLVLVGDPDQLPPVAFGQPFADMLSSGTLPTARLTKILRQSVGSAIPGACQAIRNGQTPRLVPYGEKAELRLLKAADSDVPAAASRVVRDLVRAGHNPRLDLQVLAPTKEKSCGVHALNEILAPICNPAPDPSGPTCRLVGGTGRLGDKVQQLENDYDKGVFNGDQGRIVEIAHKTVRESRIVVLFDGRDVPYTAPEAAAQLALAYAITIHRSQGSEWKSVVLCLPARARRMLTRNLLYTALSRGKGQVVVIGQEASLQQAVRIDGAHRRGGLEARLRRNLPPLPS